MAIVASDLVVYKPTFLAVTSGDKVGGPISSGLNLFLGIVDEIFLTSVSKAVAQGNTVQYSKLFCRNDHGSDTLSDVRTWIQSIEHSGQIHIALEVSSGIAVYNASQTISNPTTAPTVTGWSTPFRFSDGLLFANSGFLQVGQAQGVWLRQTISEGLTADASAPFNIAFGNIN